MGVSPNQRASYRNPCPCCGGIEKCLTYMDVPDTCLCCNPPDSLKATLKAVFVPHFGIDFWMVPYSLLGTTSSSIPSPSKERSTVNVWEDYEQAYTDLLQLLPLSDQWVSFLLSRGFLPAQIEQYGYRSLPLDITPIIEQLYPRYQEHWDRIPGFTYYKGSPSLVGKGCLLIPIRRRDRSIQGFQVRNFPGKEPKYYWFSNNGLLSPKFHHIARNSSSLILTEGPFKIDMIATTGKIWADLLSWQGVNSLSNLSQEIQNIEGIDTAYIANDMDGFPPIAQKIGTEKALRKVFPIALGTLRAVRTIREMTSWKVKILHWECQIVNDEPEPKGIDDWALSDSKPLQVLSTEDYWKCLQPWHKQLRESLRKEQ